MTFTMSILKYIEYFFSDSFMLTANHISKFTIDLIGNDDQEWLYLFTCITNVYVECIKNPLVIIVYLRTYYFIPCQ